MTVCVCVSTLGSEWCLCVYVHWVHLCVCVCVCVCVFVYVYAYPWHSVGSRWGSEPASTRERVQKECGGWTGQLHICPIGAKRS